MSVSAVLDRARAPLAVFALLALLWPVSIAQSKDLEIHTGPRLGYVGAPDYFVDVKSDPLDDNQLFVTQWSMHVDALITDYAGVLFNIVYDGHELSALQVGAASNHLIMAGTQTTPYVNLPGSQSSPQSAMLTVWHAAAANSGVTLPQSELISFFWLNGYAKNTVPCNNSDIDITITPWVIHHVGQADGRSDLTHVTVTLAVSDRVYQTAARGWATILGAGTWMHIGNTGPVQIPYSAFYASQAYITNDAGYGIEHVPEPVSMLMLLSGAGAVLIGRRRRRA